MSTYNKHRFEAAVKYGSDEDIREAARTLRDEGISHRDENAEFMAKQFHEYKRARGFGDTTQYDGVKVHAGSFSRIEVEDEPEPPREEEPPRRNFIDEDDEEDEEEE